MPESSEAQPLVVSSFDRAYREPDHKFVVIVRLGAEEAPTLHRLARQQIRGNYRAARTPRTPESIIVDGRVCYGLLRQAARCLAVGQMALAGWSVNPL